MNSLFKLVNWSSINELIKHKPGVVVVVVVVVGSAMITQRLEYRKEIK